MPINVAAFTAAGNLSGATLAISGTAVPTGALIVVIVAEANTTGPGGSVADAVGNTYVSGPSVEMNGSASNGFIQLYYVTSAIALTSGNAITYTKAVSGSNAGITAFYATGASPLDSGATATAVGSSSTPSVTSGSPSIAGDLFVAAVGYNSGTAVTFTQDGTWPTPSLLAQYYASPSGSNPGPTLGMGTRVNAGVGTERYAPTLSSTHAWAALVVAFKAASTPPSQPYKKPPRPRIKRGRWNVLDLRGRRQLRRTFPPDPPSHIPYKKPPRPRIKRGHWSVLRRKRLHYVVPTGRALSANQQIPPFSQVATFLNNIVRLSANQQIPAFSQVATLLGSKSLSANQQIPPFSQAATFAGEGIVAARLPDNVMKGARGGPTFSTARLTGFSGIEQRIINFEQSVNSYTLGYGLNKTTWPLVLALFYAQLGGAFGFGLKDWGECQIANQAIGTGDGATKNFQLVKVYATATRSYTRIITLLHSSTLVVMVNGIVSSSYTLMPGGIISFASAPAGGAAITASCDFDIQVAFDASSDHLEIQQQLIDTGQIPVINLKEIPPTATGLAIMNVLSAPAGNVDPTHLPENVEKAARGGPTFSTTRLISTSGKPFLRANYPQSVNSYTVGYTASAATWPTIQAMFYAQMGGGFGFTFRDWSDYSVINQHIGVGDGVTRNFQLVRLYDDGPRRYGRYVTLPRAGTLTITVNGTPTFSFTLLAGGVISFTSAPANNAVIAASFEFDLPMGFKDDHLDVTIQPGSAAPSNVAQIAAINLIEILPGSP
jgi:uncharacterized protein (TIGR02217 family)